MFSGGLFVDEISVVVECLDELDHMGLVWRCHVMVLLVS